MRLETLTLSTLDLPRARAFYAAQLGFPVVAARDGEWFVVDAGGVRLHVEQGETGESSPVVGRGPTSPPRPSVRKTPLERAEPRLVFHTDDLSRACTELRDRGVSVDGPRTTPGSRDPYAELADPDGHPIVLFEHAAN